MWWSTGFLILRLLLVFHPLLGQISRSKDKRMPFINKIIKLKACADAATINLILVSLLCKPRCIATLTYLSANTKQIPWCWSCEQLKIGIRFFSKHLLFLWLLWAMKSNWYQQVNPAAVVAALALWAWYKNICHIGSNSNINLAFHRKLLFEINIWDQHFDLYRSSPRTVKDLKLIPFNFWEVSTICI